MTEFEQKLCAVFGDLSEAAFNNSATHGFWDDYNSILLLIDSSTDVTMDEGRRLADKYLVDTKLSKLALMLSELGEAVEGVRKPGFDEHCTIFSNEAIELADIIIRIMDYCGKFSIPIGEAVVAKMAYNATRPYKHNKAA